MPFISNDKYETTDETTRGGAHSVLVRRIQAKRDIGKYVKAGDIGGFIEYEHNLSTEGDCWVADSGWVSGNARVTDNAWVGGDCWIDEDAVVSGNARVGDGARVIGSAVVMGDARVDGVVKVTGTSIIAGDAVLFGSNTIEDEWIFGREEV